MNKDQVKKIFEHYLANGLTQTDFTTFRDMLVKANPVQLRAMMNAVHGELHRREMLKVGGRG